MSTTSQLEIDRRAGEQPRPGRPGPATVVVRGADIPDGHGYFVVHFKYARMSPVNVVVEGVGKLRNTDGVRWHSADLHRAGSIDLQLSWEQPIGYSELLEVVWVGHEPGPGDIYSIVEDDSIADLHSTARRGLFGQRQLLTAYKHARTAVTSNPHLTEEERRSRLFFIDLDLMTSFSKVEDQEVVEEVCRLFGVDPKDYRVMTGRVEGVTRDFLTRRSYDRGHSHESGRGLVTLAIDRAFEIPITTISWLMLEIIDRHLTPRDEGAPFRPHFRMPRSDSEVDESRKSLPNAKWAAEAFLSFIDGSMNPGRSEAGDEPGDEFNGQPNSEAFFAFAELAHVAKNMKDVDFHSKRKWGVLLPIFVGCLDGYLDHYKEPEGGQTADFGIEHFCPVDRDDRAKIAMSIKRAQSAYARWTRGELEGAQEFLGMWGRCCTELNLNRTTPYAYTVPLDNCDSSHIA